MKLSDVKSVQVWDMLTENSKMDYLLKTIGHKLQSVTHDRDAQNKAPIDIINELVKADPTKNYQYLQYIVNMYLGKQFRLEDVDRIRDDLELFNKVKPKLPVEQRNITSFKSLRELYDTLKPFQNNDQDIKSGKQQKREIKDQGVIKIIDTPNFKVISPTTEEAAQFYGKGTKWCTAADKNCAFNTYNAKGKLYIIMAGDRKFQLHMEDGQFMDEQDQDISKGDISFLSGFPEYTTFLNNMIHQYYLS